MQRARRVVEALEAFAAQRSDDVLLWCYRPRLLSSVARPRLEPGAVPVPLAAGEVRRMLGVHVSRGKRTAPRGFHARLGGGCLFLAPHTNQRRPQTALHEHFGPVRAPEPEVVAAWWRTRRRARRACRLAAELIDFARAGELKLPMDAVSVHRQLLRTARVLGAWEKLLARERPRVVVVGTLWQPAARALLHAAREAGIPSVYVPHCPHRSDPYKMDLAVDYAALRGVGEADFLAGLGVARCRLDVAGDPTIVPDVPPRVDPAGPAVFAPNTERAAVLEPLIEVISQALDDEVVVGRHPAKAHRASPYPARWPIHPGRTLELLHGGPPVVLQSSSGVALEAMHLGIPVIELHFPGKPQLFPSTSEPHVRFASSSEELRAAVAASRAEAADAVHRQGLIDWARRWSWPTGQQAGERLIALVEQAIADGPREPVWDSSRSPRTRAATAADG